MNEEEKKAIKIFKNINLANNLCGNWHGEKCRMEGTKTCDQCRMKAKEVFCDLIQKLGEKL